MPLNEPGTATDNIPCNMHRVIITMCHSVCVCATEQPFEPNLKNKLSIFSFNINTTLLRSIYQLSKLNYGK